MKKVIIWTMAVVTTICVTSASVYMLTGCKTTPTTDEMYRTSVAVGTAAAMVANMTKIDNDTRNAIVEIMNKVQYSVPETNQTFEAAWTRIAEQHVAKLIDEKRIDSKQGELILATFKVVVKGMDYLTTVRYPKVRQYQDLTEAAIHGFCNGFLTIFKPANSFSAPQIIVDQAAFEYLKVYQVK